MTHETLTARAADGATTELIVHPAAHASAPIILGFPAMGTKAAYYKPLGAALAEAGYHSAFADLRGHGASSVRPSRAVDFGYSKLVNEDWPAAVAAVRARFPSSPLYLWGHSLGGQISLLYAATTKEPVAGLILVACCSVFHGGWRGVSKYKILAQTQLVQVFARALGTFPGDKLGFAGREARTQMIDWSNQSRNGLYRLTGDSTDYEAALAALKVPVLAVPVEGDNLAPMGAVDHLLAKLKNAQVSKVQHPLTAEIQRSPHFAWARKTGTLVPIIQAWMAGQPSKRV